MLLVIFGAGASYDSINTKRYPEVFARGESGWRPPLASQLFQMRAQTFGPAMQRFGVARALFMRVAIEIEKGTPVEEAIQALSDELSQTELGIRQLTALRFYLQEITWDSGEQWARLAFGQTNYALLVDDIERWRGRVEENVAYVTFNYDRMLEDALSPVVTFSSFDDYISGTTRVYKVHGSADWGHRTEMPATFSGDVRSTLIAQAPDRLASAEGWERFRGFAVSVPTRERMGSRVLLYPALALPTTGKAGFECPPEHLEALKQDLAHMDRLLVIGWRGQEEHFLRLLGELNQPAVAQVVSGSADSAMAVRGLLASRMKHLRAEGLDGGFSDYVAGNALEALLTAHS